MPPWTAVRLWLQVTGVAAAHEELRGGGLDLVRPPVDLPAGHPIRCRPGI
ncbi:hypothetical protein [Streptomyces canus]